MAGFKRAKAEQASLKIALYGPAGSGKTFTALLMAEGLAKITGKRIAYIDTERGTDFYCQSVPSRAVHPDAFDFDAIYTRSITEVLSACRSLDETTHGILVLDSITHLWEAAMAAYGGKLTKIGTIPMHAWGKIKKPYKDLMSWMLSTRMHVIICGRQKTVYQEDEETEELEAVGVTMRAEGETPYEPHILIRMESLKPKKTNEVAQIVAYAEKDRTGVLAGRSFINPTFDSLCRPILGLLGTVQAQMASTDSAAAVDAEALAEEERKREEESAVLLKQWSAKIDLVSNSNELIAIGKSITPQVKAKMTTADVSTLRAKYLEAEGKFPKGGAPSDLEIQAAINKKDFDTARDLVRGREDEAQWLRKIDEAQKEAA